MGILIDPEDEQKKKNIIKKIEKKHMICKNPLKRCYYSPSEKLIRINLSKIKAIQAYTKYNKKAEDYIYYLQMEYVIIKEWYSLSFLNRLFFKNWIFSFDPESPKIPKTEEDVLQKMAELKAPWWDKLLVYIVR